jgi:hypothetical protein
LTLHEENFLVPVEWDFLALCMAKMYDTTGELHKTDWQQGKHNSDS